jgi:hypothetical protein
MGFRRRNVAPYLQIESALGSAPVGAERHLPLPGWC